MEKNQVSSSIVQEVLMEDNYENWSICMESYLKGQGLWDIIQTESRQPENEPGFTNWERKNAMALHAILISCSSRILSLMRRMKSAKEAWTFLEDTSNQHYSQGVINRRRISSVKEDDHYVEYLPLRKALDNGNWDAVKRFLDSNRVQLTERISCTGKTALHVATIAGQVNIVEKLVDLMSEEDLEFQDQDGSTAFFAAALSGIIHMAKLMIEKNNRLVSIAAWNGMIPVVAAAVNGHEDMVRYLYSVTPQEELIPENGTNGSTLLSNCIVGSIFDVALDLLQRCPRLAFALDHEGESPLYILSQMPSAFPSGSRLGLWQRWIYSYIHVQPACNLNLISKSVHRQPRRRAFFQPFSAILRPFGIKQVYHRKLNHLQTLELLRIICDGVQCLSGRELKSSRVHNAIFQAIQHGIVEFITVIAQANPDLLWITDKNSRDIFQCAIVYRQQNIFKLIYGFDAVRWNALTSRVDRFNNNMLHLAGKLAPSTQLDHITGAALQMQRELLWFKEVERILHPKFKEAQNSDGKKPHQVFTEEHMNLMKEGEKWMKETATSCMVVATLIVTIMFAAAFTIPGGNNQNTGYPMFLKNKLFTVFLVFDVFSFFYATASVLTFLGIFVSRFAEDSFLLSLPKKMIIGLSTLFLSISTMVIAFCAALILMLHAKPWWFFFLVILPAGLPMLLMDFLHYPILVQILVSTFGFKIVNRKQKRSY